MSQKVTTLSSFSYKEFLEFNETLYGEKREKLSE